MKNRPSGRPEIGTIIFAIAALLVLLSGSVAFAQDVQTNVTYLCNGERMVVESCNIRDTSDTSTCMVQHPDRPLHNGFAAYTNETRGALKKLIPTCKQPSADEIARAQAREKKQQDLQNAAAQPAANNQAAASAARNQGQAQAQAQAQAIAAASGPKTPEQRAMARCITSGRLPATCTGNSLLGAFSQMISSALPSATKEPAPGPEMAGVFQGAGNWRLDFIDNGVLVNCSFLSPDQRSYTLEFKNDHTALIIDTTPKPLVLTLRADGTIVGPGPVTIDGVVASGYTSGSDPTSYSGGYKDGNGLSISNGQAASGGPVYDSLGNRVYGAANGGNTGHTNFASKRATCPALNLSSKGSGVGIQTMQTDLLKTMFGGDKGPPTPAGIRMHGIYAASTGFSVQFFPESAVLGCGPDAARAYPYVVVADGVKAVIKVDAPDHPLALTLKSDGSLDPGASGAYQVHGRIVTGQNDDGDFTFVPSEQSCNLGVLTPSKEIPAGGGTAATVSASAAPSGGAAANNGGRLSTPAAPLGNATLSITSGFPAQPGAPNPLAGRPYVILRDRYGDALSKGGVSVPQGVSPYKYVGSICTSRTPDCQKILDAVNASAASAVRADANGSGTFPGVPPGTYYLMISARYNNQALVWEQPVQLKAGSNSLTLNPSNATPIN
jgi:hypothetical protein